MSIFDIFVRRRVFTSVLVLIAVILGALAYAGLGLRRFPEIEFPVVSVITRYPGGQPEDIETNITNEVEDAVSSISDIEQIMSYSQQGMSLVMIEFDLETDVDLKAVDVQNAVSRVVPQLPEAADEPIVQKFAIGSFPVLTLALVGPQDVNRLYRLADEDLSPRISQVSGVADVQISGGQEREIRVLLDSRKLRKHRLPISAVSAAIRQAGADIPAGHITQPGREYTVRAAGDFQSVDDIARVRVSTPGDGIVTVADLGRVVDTHEERRSVSRFDGQQAVVLSVQAQSDANEVDVVDGVYAILPNLEEMLPAGAELRVAEDTSDFVRGALANVRTNMAIGILLTAIVLYLFLKSLRATVIAAVAMPAAVIVSFVGMLASGFSLNIISLTGLAIVIGVLVNNAILILENVTRLVHQGLNPEDAAVQGTRGIALAIFSSTATNLVVFLPIAFMGEMIGQFFRELGLTVVYATVVSLLISYSLTPMMCGLLMREEKEKPEGFFATIGWLIGWVVDHTLGFLADLWRGAFGLIHDAYMAILDWCLRHRILTLMAVAGAFVVAVMGFGLLGGQFMPRSDEGRFRITVQAPGGTPLELTNRIMQQVEREVQRVPHLQHYYLRAGRVSGFLGGSTEGVHLGEISVTVSDRAEREMSLDDLMNWLRPRLADISMARIKVEESGGGPQESPVQVEISGNDLGELQRTALQIMDIVKDVPGTSEVTKSWQSGQPQMVPRPDREALNRQAIDWSQVARDVRAYVEGETAAEFTQADENYDILVQLRQTDRDWVGDLDRLFVHSGRSGNMLRIGQITDWREEQAPTLIMRKDRRRLVTVESGLSGARSLQDVLDEIRRRMDEEVDLPSDVDVEFGGEAEMMRKNFAEIRQAMLVAAVLTFLCIAGIVESFALAAIIIVAFPVCLIGVVAAMLLAGVGMNIFSQMAMVILIGMVVNNAIIIVDYATGQDREGRSPVDAIRRACEVRFRMIVMANLTTIAALTPLSLGIGFAGEIFQPLAVVQMGGVFAAGLLSLLVIPVVYVMLRGRGRSEE